MRIFYLLALLAAFVVFGKETARNAFSAEADWQVWRLPATRSTLQGQPVWVRAFVRVPDSWTQTQGLLSQAVVLRLERIADVCQVIVNGKTLAQCGQLRPTRQLAREDSFRVKVPPGTLQRGKFNTIVLKLQSATGTVGFLGRAPILSGYHEECWLAGLWQVTTQRPQAEDMLPLGERPTTARFEQIRKGTSTLRRPREFTPGRHLTPSDALAAMTTNDDLVVDLVLHEPLITQPLSLDFDERGRLWVVQYRQYPFPAGIRMISRDKYYRAAYDGVPTAPPHHARGTDRVSIHADTNGDGQFDEHKIFVDGLNVVSSIEITNDGVWVLNPPYLLFYADRDHDDVPDGDPEVHLEGFGLEDTHSIANSLTMGPDGWLYGAQGSTTSSRIRVRNTLHPEVYRDGAMIWRYHPTRRCYEVFAEGGGNAFGLEIDAAGQVFSGHNGGNTRGFHYVQDGYFQKGTGDKYGPLSNPYTFGHLMYMDHPPTARFSHDFVRYEEQGLPAKYHGHLLAIDPLQQAVVWAELIPNGSTFRTQDHASLLTTSDIAFRPVDITVGPDGALYLADFCEEFIAHGQHYLGQVALSTGRVYRISGKGTTTFNRRMSLDRQDAVALIQQLHHPSRWHRNTARRLLLSHRDPQAIEQLTNCLTANGDIALESMWVLNRMDVLRDSQLRQAMGHANPKVRRWAVRLIGDRETVALPTVARLIEVCHAEQNVVVRSQLASTARRMPAHVALPMIDGLSRADDKEDPHLPLLLWWALEQHVGHTELVLDWLADTEIWQRPMMTGGIIERLMRRYAIGKRSDLETCACLLDLAPDPDAQSRLLSGFEQAFEGRSVIDLPEVLLDALNAAGGGSISLRIRRGDPTAIQTAAASLVDPQTQLLQRIEFARLFGQVGGDVAKQTLMEVLAVDAPTELTAIALNSLQQFDDPRIGHLVLSRWQHWGGALKADAVRLMASRRVWSDRLLSVIEQQPLMVNAIPEDAVLRLTLHEDDGLRKRVARLWPNLSSTAVNREAEVVRVTRILNERDQHADPYRGRELFTASCAKCHQLFRRGGKIGPNLTAYRRDDLLRMAVHVVDPSREIREGFQDWTAITDDGRVVTGLMMDQDDHVVTLRGVDGHNVVLVRSQLEELEPNQKSLMPAGLLSSYSDQQIRDLFAYLRISQPLNER